MFRPPSSGISVFLRRYWTKALMHQILKSYMSTSSFYCRYRIELRSCSISNTLNENNQKGNRIECSIGFNPGYWLYTSSAKPIIRCLKKQTALAGLHFERNKTNEASPHNPPHPPGRLVRGPTKPVKCNIFLRNVSFVRNRRIECIRLR